MPINYQQNINHTTQLALWEIKETESFFLQKVPLHQPVSHPHKRLQHLVGRYLLQYLFPNFPTALIEIADTRKPFLPDEQYHFSISHCGNFAAAIVSETCRVGVDVELISTKVEKIKHKFLHPEELKAWKIDELNDQKRMETLTLLWSCKEAMFKWWGRGDVDFSEVMRIDASVISEKGILKARFTKNEFDQELILSYQLNNY
ncbi:MAG: 4'-phosphopantetheinyl transferase superfamily protein, partial [Sphingobacteriia bacterium]